MSWTDNGKELLLKPSNGRSCDSCCVVVESKTVVDHVRYGTVVLACWVALPQTSWLRGYSFVSFFLRVLVVLLLKLQIDWCFSIYTRGTSPQERTPYLETLLVLDDETVDGSNRSDH